MGKITRNYLYNLVYQMLIIFVPLVTAPYLARVLGATGNGTFSYIQSTASLISTIMMLGIYAYGNRAVAYSRDNPDSLSKTFNQIMSARLVLTVLCTVVYLLFIVFSKKYVVLFFVYYTYVFAYCIDCTWLYIGVEDMKWAVIKNTITKLFSVLGIFLFVRSSDDLGKYVLIQGLSVLISNILAFSQVKRYVRKIRLDFSNLWQDLRGSVMLFLPSVATTVYLQCDKVLIELISGATDQVSFYDYSEKIITIPLAFITVLSTVMMPRIANEFKRGNHEKISDLLNRAASFSIFIALPMTFGLIIVSGKLIPWYLGDGFLPTITAIRIIAPIVVANTVMNISGEQYFTATDQIGILVRSQIIAAVGNIVLNIVLIPMLGFIGSAVATLVTSYLAAAIQWFYLLRQVKLNGLLRNSIKMLINSIIMTIVIFVLTNHMASTPFTSLVQVTLGIATYLACSFLSRDKNLTMVINQLKNRK